MKRGKKKRKPGRPKGSKTTEIKLNEQEQCFADLILENMVREKKDKLTNYACYQIAYPSVKNKGSAAALSTKLLKKPKP